MNIQRDNLLIQEVLVLVWNGKSYSRQYILSSVDTQESPVSLNPNLGLKRKKKKLDKLVHLNELERFGVKRIDFP